MKKIAIISLSVLLAACSSTNYDGDVSTESYQEDYQSNGIEEPITQTDSTQAEQGSDSAKVTDESSNVIVEQDVTASEATGEEGKKVVKLSPKEESAEESQDSGSSVRVFYPEDSTGTQPKDASYVLQVIALQSDKSLLKAAAELPSDQPKWQNDKQLAGKNWHTLLFGEYASAAEAKSAIQSLPAAFKAVKPFPRSVKSIKNSDYPSLKKIK